MLKIFKIIAILEGISLLLLFFFAMPMKYVYDMPVYVKHIGMAHGLLFVGYIIFAFLFKDDKKWDLKTFAIVCLASLLPFGTFYIEKKYL